MLANMARARTRVSAFARTVGLLAAIALSSTALWSQATSTGTVQGQIVDQQGAAVADAQIALRDVATNTPHTTISNSDGRYTFVNVNPGDYNLQVTKSGFSESKVSKTTVDVGSVLTINVTLEIGATTTTVEVQAQAGADLQTTNASVGSTITGTSITLLPNLGRDANAFVLLQPGVAPNGSVAGAVNDQNAYQLDGAPNTSDMDGNQSTYTPASGYIGSSSTGGTPSGVLPTPAESIEEFRVGTTNNTADFNGSAGGQVQMVTKRGTNQLHGALYEYYLGSNFGANFWKNNHTPDKALGLPYTPLPSSHQNRFGMALGGPVLPNFLGGKWYLFGNYEGRRFPQSTTVEKTVPSALLRAGVIQIQNPAGTYVPYNLNPYPVTVGGTTYGACGGASYCDPRGIGINPVVSKIWNTQMPLPNDLQAPSPADNYNTQGYISAIKLPQNSDFGVVRMDHDFGSKWHWMNAYRLFDFMQETTSQVDIGGVVAGDPFGSAVSHAVRPQKPWSFVTGLTTTITPTMTNDLRLSYLRNYWQWFSAAAPPQFAGLGAAVEIGGESANALIPMNIDSQDARQRFWDGKDKTVRDDVSWLKGNHLVQFGGQYQRNFDYHQRNDNGAGILAGIVNQVAALGSTSYTGILPPTNQVPTNQQGNFETYYSEVLGLVSQSQSLYTRAGSTLALQPLGTFLYDQDIIPSYDLYVSDTWHIRKDLTLTYGLSWNLEMPPYELNGKQVELTDTGGHPISAGSYLNSVKTAALAGQPNAVPDVAFTLIKNVVGASTKYPYNPFYKSFSPRVSLAYNPNFSGDTFLGHLLGENKTVIRGGYGRIYGRLNGVDLVLVPLLGTGLAQAVQCNATQSNGTCLSGGVATPANVFRIGTDGNAAPLPAAAPTLSQPYLAGLNGNAAAGDGSVLDPNFKPNHSDQFDFTIQRAISQKLLLEVGYIGRRIRDEYQGVELNAVPTMYTVNGQQFANAFANTYFALSSGASPTVQPFFEGALGGAGSAYCRAFSSCTAAVASKLKNSILGTQVFSLWNSMASSPSWTLGHTLMNNGPNQLSNVFMETSLGYGNYNALFFSFTARDWHGLTATSNFTWSRSLGTGDVAQATSEESVLNPFNIAESYGPQLFDYRFVYNLNLLYQVPYMRSQHGIVGRLLGGWSIAPLFTAQSGAPLQVSIGNTTSSTDCQAFGELNCNSATFVYENAVPSYPYSSGNSMHNNVLYFNGVGSSGNPRTGGSGLNMFTNPSVVLSQFRPLVLGYDTSQNGTGILRGFPAWSVDLAVNKDFQVTERLGATFIAQFSNVLNHFQPANPTLNINNPSTFGVVTAQSTTITPRQIEFGLRIHF
ncbi:MAG: carboxypeptidase regulatory-like domain-containing protein [Acidobacteriaceae bacterium]|nr:carboxypeptidase regulatory-like domain-containing protein [Acidobacteriaceae bacterium]